MTHLWRTSKNMVGWLLGQQPEQCNCDWPDEDEAEVQESSGVGTVIVIYTALAGLFIGANLLPSQVTQSPPALRDRDIRKEQQRRRSKQPPNDVNRRSRRKQPLDNFHDALQPTAEEEAQWLKKSDPGKKSAKEVFFDVTNDNSEKDHFIDVHEE
ncbi:uncharacterized protein LOC115765320 [Drosophila novamexicana]|uniref:uncharacterized protein LOC115765320 n=1 Tax=Drosophila novamexicana TaxID=47314 RepID=UPI0011E5DC1C|nr:uncharacterized protein LOC115765320 [Drosophila novamexicana]XP_030564681.1 uncharacterized protein LOC115765320 [Drosophila novamexicana]